MSYNNINDNDRVTGVSVTSNYTQMLQLERRQLHRHAQY